MRRSRGTIAAMKREGVFFEHASSAATQTPLSLVHARAICAATEAGAIIAPPVPALYLRPRTVEELIDHTVARVLDLFEIDVGMPRWGEPLDPGAPAVPRS